MWLKIWSVIEKNRWTVIAPCAGIILWLAVGICCTPETASPTRPTVLVNAAELELDFQTWQADCNVMAKKFEYAGADIKQQAERNSKIESGLMALASGNVTSYTGLLGLLTSSGLVGLFADNIRKNGVIGGLKRNNTPA